MYIRKTEHSFYYEFCSAKFLVSQKGIVGKECDMYGETGNMYEKYC